MSDDEHDDERTRRIIGRSPAVAVPPFDALRRAPTRSARRSVAVTLATVIVAVAALYAGQAVSTFRQQQASPSAGVAAPSATTSSKVVLPQPILQPITRTSAAAQVAWLINYTLDSLPPLIGVDPSGTIVGRIDASLNDGRSFRSSDGALLALVANDHITTYSGLDGSRQRIYPRRPNGGVIDAAFSPDGQWLAVIAPESYVQVFDLRSGLSQTIPLVHDPNAATPGMSGTFNGPIWSTLVFSLDSKRLYTLVDWGGPMRVTSFDVTASGLVQAATALSGQGAQRFVSCDGPGLTARVVPGGQTLIAFCHYDGDVWLIDLRSLTLLADIRTGQTNPFEFSPIFTPDGQLVYVRGSTRISAVDVATRRVVGPAAAPATPDAPGPFSWLFGQANAGYIASTVPISPDGTKLYFSDGGGIKVLRIPDLKLIRQLASGLNLAEVWVSGDGKTVFATDAGHSLYVIPESGGSPVIVTLPGQNGGYFIASEHG